MAEIPEGFKVVPSSPEIPEGFSIVEPEPTAGDYMAAAGEGVAGGIEAIGTMASGMGSTVAGGLLGAAATPFVGAKKGADIVEAVQEAGTYQPRTQAGQQAIETIGDLTQLGLDVANYPASGVAGLLELVAGQGTEQAAQTIKDVQDQGLGKAFGSRILEETGSPLAATFAEMTPELAGALIPLKGMKTKRSNMEQAIADKIKGGSRDSDLAKYMVDGAGKLKTDKNAVEAVRQGFSAGVIQPLKGSSDIDRRKMAEMLQIKKRGLKDELYGVDNRPSQVVGDSLMERVKYVAATNKSAGNQLDAAAKSLKGKPVDFSDATDGFINNLDNMGIRLAKRGDTIKPRFKGSDIEGLPALENAISRMVSRMQSDGRPDAYDVHRLKRVIDEQVSYGKAGEGLSGRTERVLKQLRHDLDGSLDRQFPEYDQVNTRYSDTINALDELQKEAGRKLNFESKGAEKQAGVLLRRLMGNTQGRTNLLNAMDSIDDAARKYGGKFDDNIKMQSLWADELDKMFGASARTSLMGDMEKAMPAALDVATGGQTLYGAAAQKAGDMLDGARGVNTEAALSAAEKLLNR